jgi:4-amino-4-deoxy-L-arabinose transferase-like glycosyltransferase
MKLPNARLASKYSTYLLLFIVLLAATGVRLYRLSELPLGAFVDEIFMLDSSLLLLESPVDPIGHTLAVSDSWGKDHPNLFLYFNILILKIFGVSYWSMKLLSVIPGVVACGMVFLIARRIFDQHVALATSLLFAFAHWSIRLSRYGWDVSLMLATLAAAVWLLLVAMQTGRSRYAYCAGAAAGLCLYTYLGGRIALFSLIIFLVLECLFRRDRSMYRHALAFASAATVTALPFFFYYLSRPSGLWSRTSEVSAFNASNPTVVILTNIVNHGLMFNWVGGTFARDNVPGLQMMDPITSVLLVVGIAFAVRRRDAYSNLLLCTFFLNFAGGVFSKSQEGAPYVYRTSAVIVPAFVIVGVALEWLVKKIGCRWLAASTVFLIGLNLYLYFSLEEKNTAAMRVMAYEPRLIGQEIAHDNVPVWLVADDVLTQTEVGPKNGEKYASSNPAVVLSPVVRKLAIINFSGRYDMHRTVADNLAQPRDIYFPSSHNLAVRPPGKIIFKSSNQAMIRAAKQLGASLRYLPNILGEPLITVADLPES